MDRLRETCTLEGIRAIDFKLSASMSSINVASTPLPPTTPIAPTIKLPNIKFEPFSGDIGSWPRFGEQFQSTFNTNPSVSSINKHAFLTGNLEGESKFLVVGIAVTAET